MLIDGLHPWCDPRSAPSSSRRSGHVVVVVERLARASSRWCRSDACPLPLGHEHAHMRRTKREARVAIIPRRDTGTGTDGVAKSKKGKRMLDRRVDAAEADGVNCSYLTRRAEFPYHATLAYMSLSFHDRDASSSLPLVFLPPPYPPRDISAIRSTRLFPSRFFGRLRFFFSLLRGFAGPRDARQGSSSTPLTPLSVRVNNQRRRNSGEEGQSESQSKRERERSKNRRRYYCCQAE
jgi:hypothetical protein